MRSNHSAIKHNLCATKRKGGKSESRSFMSKQKQLQCKGEVKAECRKSVQTVRGKGFLIDLNLKERNIRTKHSSNILHKSLIDVCECSYISSCYESKYPANIFFFYVPTRISLMFSCVYSHYVCVCVCW